MSSKYRNLTQSNQGLIQADPTDLAILTILVSENKSVV